MHKSWIRSLRRPLDHSVNRSGNASKRRRHARKSVESAAIQVERLEERALLTALVIEQANLASFLQSDGSLQVTNADLAGFDAIAIDGVTVDGSQSDGLRIDVSSLTLRSISLLRVNVANSAGTGISLNLDNVSDLESIAIDSTSVDGSGGIGIDISVSNMTVGSLDISRSLVDGVRIDGDAADIQNGSISQNRLEGSVGVNGILLNLSQSSADEFTIIENSAISSATEDAVLINLDDSPLTGLHLLDNQFAPARAVGAELLIDGDTFNQPFTLTNSSLPGSEIARVTLDVGPAGLEFDDDPVTGRPFTVVNNTDIPTGFEAAVVAPTQLRLDFNIDPANETFGSGETFQWLIDLDLLGADTTVFGNQLIGSTMRVEMSTGDIIDGVLVAVPGFPDAAKFVTTTGGSGGHGINLVADDSPVTDLLIGENRIQGNVEGGIQIAANDSSITGAIFGNEVNATGGDGVELQLVDSEFSGLINGNLVGGNSGAGFRFSPSVDLSGFVQGASNENPIVITSTNHGLIGGETVVVQGVDGNVQANGRYVAEFVDVDRFRLLGSDGSQIGTNTDLYEGGGTWFVPRGAGNIIAASNDGSPISITTAEPHGLSNGDVINVQGVRGNLAANGTQTITVTSPTAFTIDGVVGTGDFDPTVDGFSPVPGAVWWLGYRIDLLGATRSGFDENQLTTNAAGGVEIGLPQGTAFDAFVRRNLFQNNSGFGWQTTTVAGQFDLEFGSVSSADSNRYHANLGAGIALNVLNSGEGSFEIRKNIFTSQQNDSASSTFNGDGVNIRLEGNAGDVQATGALNISVIDGNTFGVDNLGNDGSGIAFHMQETTSIDTLHVTNNTFINNGRDGFQFFRRDDASLNAVNVEKNTLEGQGSDGFDFFAQNTTRDVLDFQINENEITNNAEYGVRIRVEADARIEANLDNNSIDFNGSSRANGNHPNDGLGNAGLAGGVGLIGFQQVEVRMNLINNRIRNNVGDGFSADAPLSVDTMRVKGVWSDNIFSDNLLTGFRQDGVAFGGYEWADNEFTNNGEDGARILDGDDLDLSGTNNSFVGNGSNGLHLGRAVSAIFGDSSLEGMNRFSTNGEDGLKITQGSGRYLLNRGRVRDIVLARNDFLANGGDGLDAGQDPSTGNPAHGDDVVTFTKLSVTNSQFFQNGGDGIEWLSDAYSYPHPVSGSIVESTGSSGFYNALAIRDSHFKKNGGRGIDILNRGSEDVRVSVIDSTIQSNRLVGLYVMNTNSQTQAQNGPADDLNQDGGLLSTPNLELKVRDNTIESNGNADSGTYSNLPMPYPLDDLNYDGATSDAEAGGANQIGAGLPVTTNDLLARGRDDLATDKRFGTLGGLVVRVGTAGSDVGVTASTAFRSPFEPEELSNYSSGELRAGVRSEIVNNAFDGNFGSEIYFDSFTSTQLPPQTSGVWHIDDDPDFAVGTIVRDPLSRFDLAFRGNTGNSLDVTNGYAFYNNNEPEFKSRSTGVIPGAPANPGHNDPAHPSTNPPGPNGDKRRKRNAARTLGADMPTDPIPLAIFGFEGWGDSAWRLEDDWNSSGFDLTDPVFGYSDFDNVVALGNPLIGELPYAWDTAGLSRDEIFGGYIAPDRLEDNDHFVSATDLGTADMFVEPGLTIDTRDDADLFTFIAATAGPVDVTVDSHDPRSEMEFRIFEVDPDALTEESQLGTPRIVPAGGTGSLNFAAVAGRRYFVKVDVDPSASLYGTISDYDISIDAPGGTIGGGGGGGGTGGGGGGGGFTPPTPGGLTGPIIVTTDLDTVAVNPGDGTAEDATGAVSLRSAVMESNIQPGDDEIQLPAGRYTFSLAGINEDFAERGDLDIRDSVTIVGAGAGATIVDADEIDRLFEVFGGQKLRLEGVTLLDGGASEGGAVYNAGRLEIVDSIVGDPASGTDGNTAYSLGGGIYNAAPIATVLVVSDPVDAPVDALSTSIQVADASSFAELPTPFDVLLGDELVQVVAVQGNSLTVIRGLDGRNVFEMPPGSEVNDGDVIGIITDAGDSVVLEFSDVSIDDGLTTGTVEVLFEKTDLAITIASKVAAAINTVSGLSGLRVDASVQLTGGVFSPSSTAVPHNDGEELSVVFAGQLEIQRSTLFGNSAASRGGAVFNRGTAEFYNATFSGNSSSNRGGAVYNEGTVTMINSTIVEGHAKLRSGGIDNDSSSASFTLGNSIVAENSSDGFDPDLRGDFNSLFANVVGIIAETAGAKDATGFDEVLDFTGSVASPQDPEIGPLVASSTVAPGSGTTWVHVPDANSFLIDRGQNALIEDISDTDGRQSSRLVDATRDQMVVVDIGAVEVFVDEPVASFSIDSTPTDPGENVIFDATGTSHTNPSGHADPSTYTYEWDLDNDGLFDDAVGQIANRIFPALGVYPISLRVTDDNAVIDTLTQEVVVSLPQKTVIRAPFVVTSDHTPTIRWDDVGANYFLWVRRLSPDPQDNVIFEQRLTDNFFTPTTPLPAGNYRAWVQTYNNLGDRSDWSDPYDFTIVDATLLTPQGEIFDPTPVFSWTAIPGTATYDLWVRDLTRGQDQVIREDQIPGRDTQFEAVDDLQLGRYRAWLRATTVTGEVGDWSQFSEFEIVTTTMISPRSTMNQRPTFSWTPVDGATRYDLQVTNVDTGVEIIRERFLSSTTYLPTFDLPNALYSARVRPLDDSSVVGYFSEPIVFRINTTFFPTLIHPVGNVFDTTPRFSWRPVPGANRYDLWVRNLTTGEDQVIREENLTDRIYDSTTRLQAGVYRWWVRAFSESTGLPGQWSNPLDFTIPRPVVNAPSDPVTNTRFPTISWSTVPEFVRFDLWVRNLTTGEDQIIRRRDLTTNEYTKDDYLADGLNGGLANGRYRVWVRGFDADGWGTYWSEGYDFSVSLQRLDAPQLIAPFGTLTNPRPSFSWRTVDGADHYEILVKELIGNDDSNQITVLDVRDIPHPVNSNTVTYLPPQNFDPGNYRWWVRAVNSVGLLEEDFSVYSNPLDFTITANEPASSSDADGKIEPAGQVGPTEALSELETIAVMEHRTVIRGVDFTVADADVQPNVNLKSRVAESSIAMHAEAGLVAGMADAFMESWHAEEWWNDAAANGKSDYATGIDETGEAVMPEIVTVDNAVLEGSGKDSGEGRTWLGWALPIWGLNRLKFRRKRSRRS